MGVFDDLAAQFDPVSTKRKGDEFELVCKWFLENDPIYQPLLRAVWLWDDWPGPEDGADPKGIDAGIDLVAEDHDGKLWAIQAKAYDPKYSISKRDVDKFVAESSRKTFTHRLLIGTTDKRHHLATRLMDDLGIPFVGLTRLRKADDYLDWPASPDALSPATPLDPKEPWDYQQAAINEVVKGFETSDRGQLIMACGTGKTLTAWFITEKLASNRAARAAALGPGHADGWPWKTLVLVPSLSLLKQTLTEWRLANPRTPFEAMVVCSDESVGSLGPDAAVSHTSDLGVPVTTDHNMIATFLRHRTGPARVVFATYQSSPQIAAAFDMSRNKDGSSQTPGFDLVIADEAHRVAGPVSSDFATVLDPTAIVAERRLFMTATPRFFTGRVLKEAKEADYEVASMDDTEKFGEVFHRLSFAGAIDRKLLTDYQVAIIGVDDATYLDWAERGTLVTLDGNKTTDARSLAGQIGLAKAMRKFDLRRVISFHSRVKASREFAASMPAVLDWMPARQRPKGLLWSQYASGEMSAGERSVLIGHLKRLDDGERGLLANARCLAEGVDVPALDGVAFIDPRRSEVDIVQAVGRAIRKTDDKTVGTIVIPVFIDTDQDAEVALDSSVFKPVWDVIKALRSHDELLGEQLDALRREMGRKRGNPQLPSKIHVDLPVTVPKGFSDALEAKIVEQTTASWEFWMGLMDGFITEKGHALVPVDQVTSGYKLGHWVSTQRHLYRRAKLAEERAAQLDGLPGWSWEPSADNWTVHYNALKAYAERTGAARPPAGWEEKGLRLGQWVNVRRRLRETLSPKHVDLLEQLPGWSWNPNQDRWEQGYEAAAIFAAREGHVRVHNDHIEDGVSLGVWVVDQRMKRDKLTHEQRERLEALPGWTWDARADRWNRNLELLRQYQRREGDALVPQGHIEDGVRLGTWVLEQRNHEDSVSTERRALLEAVPGWSWDPHADRWDRAYAVLLQFAARESHALVPKEHVEDGINLGGWISLQRQKQYDLSADRRKRLEAVPGWTWNPTDDSWVQHLEHLKIFTAREGNTLVPADHLEGGLKLGQWVRLRRKEQQKLNAERSAQLEAIPGWFWGTKTDFIWEERYSLLRQFTAREGHARVPFNHKEDGIKLGSWVVTQRTEVDSLSNDRRARLESLPGWSWDVSEDAWEEKYKLMTAFAGREGHARVPQGHVEDGVALGKWLAVQRQKRDKLTPEQRARLEVLPGWSWDPFADQWNAAYAALVDYIVEHGTSSVPYSYVSGDVKLGQWVNWQRNSYSKCKLTDERRKRLEALKGWVWDAQ